MARRIENDVVADPVGQFFADGLEVVFLDVDRPKSKFLGQWEAIADVVTDPATTTSPLCVGDLSREETDRTRTGDHHAIACADAGVVDDRSCPDAGRFDQRGVARVDVVADAL